MNPIEHLNRLDELIVEHTKAPVTALLRNQLSPAREQTEALQAAYDKLRNDHVVLKNRSDETIARLNEELVTDPRSERNGGEIAYVEKRVRSLINQVDGAKDDFPALRASKLWKARSVRLRLSPPTSNGYRKNERAESDALERSAK